MCPPPLTMDKCGNAEIALKVFEAALIMGVNFKLDPEDLKVLENLSKSNDHTQQEMGKYFERIKDMSSETYLEKPSGRDKALERLDELGVPKELGAKTTLRHSG